MKIMESDIIYRVDCINVDSSFSTHEKNANESKARLFQYVWMHIWFIECNVYVIL